MFLRDTLETIQGALRLQGELVVASQMFRSKADNNYYAGAKRPQGAGTWHVFYYDLRGKKVRLRVGSNRKTAELAKGDIEARLAKQRAGLLNFGEFRGRSTEFKGIE